MANSASCFDIARLAMTQLPFAAPQFSQILMPKLMNSTNRSRAINALLICAAMLYANATSAQEADVFDDVPSSVTSSLISRKELNRLLHQPPKDQNPLRRAKRLPNRSTVQNNQNTFRDPNVRAASWQQEQPNAATSGIQVQTIPDMPQVQDFPEPRPHQGFPNTPPLQNVPAKPPLQVNPETAQTETVPAFGPQPSLEMQSSWHMLDMLLEIPVDKLKQEIAVRRSEIESSFGIDDASKSAALEQIEIAEAAAQQANQHTISKADFQNRVVELKQTLEQLRLESKKITKATPIDRSLPVNSMQVILRDLQTELDDAKSDVENIQRGIEQRDKRIDRIPTEQLNSRNEVNDLHEKFLEQHSKGTKDIDILLALKARELAASTNVQKLDQEASWHDLSQELLPLQKTIHQREVHRLEQEVKQWSDTIANRKQVELEKQIREARQQAIATTHPDLKEFSQQTAELAQARAVVAEKIGGLQAETLKVSKQDDDVKERHKALDKSIREAGEEESRELLIQVHRNLIRPYEGMARILDIESERRLTRGTILKLRSEKEQIADSEEFIREQLKIKQDKPIAGTTLIAMAEEAIETHLEQLIELERDSTQYEKLLKKVLLQREDLLKEINTTRELVDTHALWIQSADPLSVALIAKSGEGAKEFFDHAQWSNLGNSIVDRVTRRPYECVLGMLGLLVTVFVGRRFKG